MIGLFVVLVSIGIGLAMMLTPDHRLGVTKANFDKLQVGMSKRQVDARLGTPSGGHYFGGLSGGLGSAFWIGEDGAKVGISYSVRYVDDDQPDWKVDDMTWTPSTETPWQRIRRVLRIPV